MITLRISSAAAVETRPVPWWCHPAMAQTATRTGEVMYQTGITAPSSRAPWVRPCRPLSPGRPSRIGVTKKATENSTPTITPTTTVVKTSACRLSDEVEMCLELGRSPGHSPDAQVASA